MAQTPTQIRNNPWFQLHIQSELDFTGGGYTRKQAIRLVMGEFAHGPDPMPCTQCDGGTAWYRPTVGAMQCSSCRAMYRTGSRELVPGTGRG